MRETGGLALTVSEMWEDCMEQDKLLTQKDVAERLSISTRTVGEWLRSGKLKGMKIGKLWRVKESELQRFIDEQK